MKGVYFAGDREIAMLDFPDPDPGPRDVVVKMLASGMCGSDLHGYRASKAERAKRPPNIGGHEPCGEIVARGSGVSEAEAPIGQRVMIYHYTGCEKCKMCRIGYYQMCPTEAKVYGGMYDGGHAPYMTVKPYMMVPLPDELTAEEGAAISCGTGTAYMAIKRLNVSGRDTLAVYGQGPVGLSATMLAKAMGARVIGVDVGTERLDLAREYGADEVVDASEVDPVKAIHELTHGDGAEATLDCTGNSTARANTVRSTQNWGRACYVGEGGDVHLTPSSDIIHRQVTLYGSWTFNPNGMADCAQFVIDRKVPLKKLLTHRFKLDEADAAYKLFDTQTTGKGVFLLD